ncbi:hypothetical protein TRFO_19180 [Tritrichomonas foetus]|uniref:Uncharacterized protein n=1 Tax=Tritrichomonas foetus TaxID=1144522 RepID=A0A1J4KNU7_9EUKA|nr:hypothetical protein TRFO_19180 [Tritrichomonas foetus]|eukprot:OHT11374.1 hypothetical protein TRFO_19180 [Tritrichomonas foetus]
MYDWIKETGLDIRSNRQHSSVLYNAIMHFNFPIILDTLDEIPQLTNFLLHCGVLDNREVYQLFQEVEHTSHLTYLSSLIYSLNNNLLKNEFTKANATLNQSLFQTLLGMLIKINDIEIYNYFSSFAHDLSKNKDIFELAVESNAWRIVKLIVQDEKFDVDLYINNNNRINFRNNISNRQIALYRDFLEIKGFDINKTYTSTGGSVFSLLTWCGAVNLVKYVYNISSFNINKRGAIGETPLTGCSLNNLPELAGFLVSLKGIKVNKKNKSHLNTPIEIALQKQHVDVILALLNHPELIFNSEDLIKFACKRNDLELAQKIVNHTKFETEKWDIYLNEIIKSQSQNVFQVLYDLYLRDNHIKITHSHNKDKYNKKTLLCAFKVAVVKLSDINLYKKYFNSNDLSNELEEITNQKLTKSPLFYALKNPNCLAYLLNKTNLDPNVVDKKGFTLIQKAVQTKSHHSIQVLIEDQRVVLDFRDKEYLINESEKNVRNLLLESNRLKFNSIDIRKFGINIQIIQNLLQFGFNDMNFVQKYDYLSPLQLSIEEGNIELFSYILTLSGINFNLNGTLIHLMNHFDIQEFISFINNKQINIDVNYYDDNYYTALIHATSNNQLEYIHALLEHPDIKIDLVVRNVSALSCVITIEACDLLIKHGAKAINYVNLQGITPLCYSIKNNQDGLFNYLINLNMIDYTKENNCFSASLKNENKKYFEIISTKEIKPDRQSLVFAIDHIDHYLLSIILPHFGPLDGFLPLANADEKTLQILFDHGFDFSIIPESFERRDSRYLLLTAVEENNLCLVQRILTYENIQINFTDERGEFPLGIALYNGYHKIALLLLRQPGINVNLLFHNEYPPIMIVAQLKTIHHSIQIELIELILKNSHEMLNFERNGKTALSLALEKRNILVIHFLQNIPNIKIAPSIVGYCIMQKNIELFKIILHSQEYLLIEKEIQNIFACKFYEAVSLLTNDDRIKCNDFSFLEHSSIKYESPKNIIRDFVLSKADCNNPNIVRNLMKYSFCIYSPFQSIVQKIDNINEVYKGVTHLMFSLEEHFLNEAFAFIVDPRIDFYIPNKHGKNVLQMNFNDYPDLQNLLITIQNLKQKLPS